MSRTIADFPTEDANLYFRGTYCMDMERNEPLLVREIGNDTVYAQTSAGDPIEVPSSTVCQWWPESRGANIMLGRKVAGVLLSRRARRQSRRSICQNTASVLRIGERPTSVGYRRAMDLSTAKALYDGTHYVELGIAPLVKFIEEQTAEGVTVLSVCVGRRLFYKPLWNNMVGQLYYSHLGMLGVVDLSTGHYKPVSTQSRVARRAAHSVERFLC